MKTPNLIQPFSVQYALPGSRKTLYGSEGLVQDWVVIWLKTALKMIKATMARMNPRHLRKPAIVN